MAVTSTARANALYATKRRRNHFGNAHASNAIYSSGHEGSEAMLGGHSK
jgi:hypothetical protein